ncbi:MAG TPA: hypothetical protein PLJ21_01855, partial [Pseudobdellovibrionaceae bacterium]|nr:hypothetical protein [Pseudobdellovibrionaceae bacterium]
MSLFNHRNPILTFLTLTTLSALSFAGPILSDTCGGISKQIRTPKNAGSFFMDKDCSKAYILPPPKGSMEVVSVMASA